MNEKNKSSLLILTLIVVSILVIGTIVTMLIIKKEKNKETNIKDNFSTVDSNSKVEQNDNTNESLASNNTFWVDNYKNWEKQKDEFKLVLFNGKCTAPIDLKTLDNLVTRYDYYIKDNRLSLDDRKKHTRTINDIINSEDLIDPTMSIWMYYGDIAKFTNYGYKDSLKVDVKNYDFVYDKNEVDISLKDAINKNWWCIENTTDDATISLGIDIDDTSYDHSTNAIPLLDKVIEILGCPKHIYTIDKTLDGSYKELDYLLSYEYDEFVLTIKVNEDYVGDYYQCGIKSVSYFPKESFEKYMEQKLDNDYFVEIMK